MHALPTGRLQARLTHAIRSCVAASRRSSPCHVGSGSRAAGIRAGIVKGVGIRGGHSPHDLIMNSLMIRSPGCLGAAAAAEEQLRDGRCCGGWGQPGPARAAPRGHSKEAPSSHRRGDGCDGADSVRPASRLRRVRSTKKSRRSRALAKFGPRDGRVRHCHSGTKGAGQGRAAYPTKSTLADRSQGGARAENIE